MVLESQMLEEKESVKESEDVKPQVQQHVSSPQVLLGLNPIEVKAAKRTKDSRKKKAEPSQED